MAPKKRKAEDNPTVAPGRVTRSSTRKASETEAPPVTQPEKKVKKAEPKKKGAKAKKVEEAENGSEVPEAVGDETEKATKTIVIEHCKQCQSFKRRAEEAKKGLSKGLSGVEIVFNPEKPRRGCFEIREEGGEKFVTLLDLKRPFNPMKALDMDKVVEDIIKKIKC